MNRKTVAAAAVTLCASAAMAQDLSIRRSSPVQGDLLVHSGTFSADESFVDDDHCPRGERREQTTVVRFDPPYPEAPQVLVSLSQFDFDIEDDRTRNPRILARAESVSRNSMILVVATWCNTNLASAGGTYLAIGRSVRAPEVSAPPRALSRSDEILLELLDEY